MLGRLAENDRRYGPLTVSNSGPCDTWKAWYVFYETAHYRDDDGNYHYCNSLTMRFGRLGIARLKLPAFIKPYIRKVKATFWSEEDIKRMGRDYYIEAVDRKYGIIINDSIQVYWGKGDPWCWALPWNVTSLEKVEYLDPDGRVIGVAPDFNRNAAKDFPKIHYLVRDFDGTELIASCQTHRATFRRLHEKYAWLGKLFPRKIYYRGDIKYSEEVGHGKGSWKGGTLGCSFPINPGEDWFPNHAAKNGITVIRQLSEEEALERLASIAAKKQAEREARNSEKKDDTAKTATETPTASNPAVGDCDTDDTGNEQQSADPSVIVVPGSAGKKLYQLTDTPAPDAVNTDQPCNTYKISLTSPYYGGSLDKVTDEAKQALLPHLPVEERKEKDTAFEATFEEAMTRRKESKTE